MAYIEKRKHPNGKITYRARVRQAGSPDLSASFPTRTQATKWGQKMEAEVRGGRYFGREETKERTFAEFIDRYIEKELTKNPETYKKQLTLLAWWKLHLGRYFLCHITPSMIAELRDRLMVEKTRFGTPRTPSTANRYLAALSRAFTICLKEWGWIKENPVLKISRPKENKPRERYLDEEEIERLLQSCQNSKSPYLHAIVVFALGTGARKGEILGLKWEDVDFKRSSAIFRVTKNGETRAVYLSEQVVSCLRKQLDRRLVISEYVFPSVDGKRPADIKTAWENVVKEVGFKDVCFHSLRHTAASHLAMGGVTTLEIAAILGHKSLSMVKRYSHLSTASTAQSLMQMNDKILGAFSDAG